MRTIVTADIHGNYKALMQCIERSKFDYYHDRLICLGDTVDGHTETRACINELLKIRNIIYIIGNHDAWALEWYDPNSPNRASPDTRPKNYWVEQGGRNTLKSYAVGYDLESSVMPITHVNLLKGHTYHLENNRLFVHGGIDPNKKVEKQNQDYIMWDRVLLESAWRKAQCNPTYKFGSYDEIYLGHTSVQYFGQNRDCKPLFLCNVIALDTGAGWDGKLTFMDVDTKEYWQSDFSRSLYPNFEGR